MIRAVFFDVDGTLIDVDRAERAGVHHLYTVTRQSARCDFDTFFNRWVELRIHYYDGFYRDGRLSFAQQRFARVRELFASFGDALTAESVDSLCVEYGSVFAENWTTFDDVESTLAALHGGCALGVITNGERSHQIAKLRATGISAYFSWIVTPETADEAKPSTAMFVRAQNLARVEAREMCYVGNSVDTDMLPCAERGLVGVLIDRQGLSRDGEGHCSITDLRVLAALPACESLIPETDC